MPVVTRLAKRKAAWEGEIPDSEILEVEFRTRTGEPDLRPSVYELDDDGAEQLLRTCAEHSAAIPLRAPSTHGIYCEGQPFRVLKNPGSGKFRFIRDRHRELELQDIEELKVLIDLLKVRGSQGRMKAVSKASVVEYATERIRSKDAEWVSVVDDCGDPEWLAKAKRRAAASDAE